jgi:ribose/xylose/arabinose/galactoside ABC-type transport system permease subunit
MSPACPLTVAFVCRHIDLSFSDLIGTTNMAATLIQHNKIVAQTNAHLPWKRAT